MERDFQNRLLPFALREKGPGVEGQEAKQDFFDALSNRPQRRILPEIP
jgi:hypothetical protein